ncbi:MAG: tRNA (adenosine(37)-N6)-threonylcarbamoyltransferase complex ATPase subunit type 1 TsaE [Aquificae bacterium]|nr:tRNA (adenosine(37)-N6)-threonylcarbamoyltransferase complex ATPase subunit type 1 TsaE [Aquificota bacterium]
MLTEEDTARFAREFVKKLKGNEVVCLEGELGAGKTTFVRYAVEALGPEKNEQVRSPSFTLVNLYRTAKGEVYHADFYRAETELEEFVGKGLVFVEWPKGYELCDYLIKFEVLPEGRRVRVFKR